MEILDAQIHTCMTDHPTRPWDRDFRREKMQTGGAQLLVHAGQVAGPETILIAMAEVGVDGALLVPVGQYGLNNDFELDAACRFPRSFGVVGLVDHREGGLLDRLREEMRRGLVGVRLLAMRYAEGYERREFDNILRVCSELRLPVTLMVVHSVLPHLRRLITENPDVTFVADHLGVGMAPPLLGSAYSGEPWENLDAVCELASHPNLCVKLSGAPALSREDFPFKDIHDPVLKLIEAYGPDRMMWGSDYTRTNALYSYWDEVHYLPHINGLDADTLTKLYGQTLRKIFRWDRAKFTGSAEPQ